MELVLEEGDAGIAPALGGPGLDVVEELMYISGPSFEKTCPRAPHGRVSAEPHWQMCHLM
jgi:hypothetical protein